ncbi:hypothetical protein [Variovorax fucosicus]|uniref:hypothetical protein n=1 Tax=Variovorax fucosicus TaxID=3053517 RepID=UPI0025766604|nr:hypothetical protein [Variovorax sp. J22G47]MDM0055341.1 hypothetical protein [Variovorax sp. J22G47]
MHHRSHHFLGIFCSLGIVAAAPAAMAGTTVIENPGSGTNRIEVSGNKAQNVQVQCADGNAKNTAAAGNVNSVNIDGRALQGKTVIVTGRNSRDVRADADCKGGAAPNANVNSVNIR